MEKIKEELKIQVDRATGSESENIIQLPNEEKLIQEIEVKTPSIQKE